jgi:toxin ParE1/3/4
MYNYFLSKQAKDDLLRIYEYGVAQFGLYHADKYYDKMYECFDKIESNPYMFPLVIKYKNAERFCVCGVDTIYYNINGNDVEIITIIGRQELK